ncbi:tapetal oleosin GRP-16-like [Miscanthus floridulus]|uniref:tapetal oleosin GRP-16-like n=1 Tax=Miscanthus floridulus TaxID=154761 RepID=UPI00345741E2
MPPLFNYTSASRDLTLTSPDGRCALACGGGTPRVGARGQGAGGPSAGRRGSARRGVRGAGAGGLARDARGSACGAGRRGRARAGRRGSACGGGQPGVRAWDAGCRHAGAGTGGRVWDAERRGLVWAGAGPAVETLGVGSLTASEEEDNAPDDDSRVLLPIYTRYYL